MSKAYKNKICVYCLQRPSEDGDHVIARQFFLPEQRCNLPKVPACKICNNEKSKIEHYLTTVMPFGGNHDNASDTLNTLVPNRLINNIKLHNTLADEAIIPCNQDTQESATIPLDGNSLAKLYEFIIRGLAWHHWRILIGEKYIVRAGYFINEGSQFFNTLLGMNASQRVTGNLGGGVFQYEGVQANDCPQLTIWKMSLYGAEVSGDPANPSARGNFAFGISVSTQSALMKELPNLFFE
ncbi:MAG: HNH endonuclease [Polynucleobacter sp.]